MGAVFLSRLGQRERARSVRSYTRGRFASARRRRFFRCLSNQKNLRNGSPRRRGLRIVRGDIFIIRSKRHRSPAPSRLLSAKGLARIFCSVVNALTTKTCRYQPFAVRALARISAFATINRFLSKKKIKRDYYVICGVCMYEKTSLTKYSMFVMNTKTGFALKTRANYRIIAMELFRKIVID
jgi:hypothetical protein